MLTNLSGSPVTIGRAEDRCLLARSGSLRCAAAYIYAAAGEGESTTDLERDGQTMIWEHGVCLAQSQRFPTQRNIVLPMSISTCCAQRGDRAAYSTRIANTITLAKPGSARSRSS